ncbi:hypothetical protein N9L92_01985, partial [Saprospiraceae bacterium]|nr:hypothetical protein [Saprospiraceae bacterium]
MRLVLQFSPLPTDFFNPTDIVLTTEEFLSNTFQGASILSIESFNVPHDDYRKKFDDIKDLFLEETDFFGDLRKIFEASLPAFYNHVYGNYVKWFHGLNEVLNGNPGINEIVLSDAIEKSNYIPFYESEGEVNRKLFYNSYDFIPRLLFSWLRSEGYNCTIYRRRSRIKLMFNVFMRRYALLHLMVLIIALKKIRYIFNSNKIKRPSPYSKKLKFIFAS